MTTGIKRAVALATAFGLFAAPAHTDAAVYYETKAARAVTKGATLETSTRIVDGGLINVYALTVSVDEPYISLAPVSSAEEYGLKEPTTKLLADAGAYAGVNGDYFGVAGAYSVPLGVEAAAGRLSVADNAEKQAGKAAEASFIISGNGTPFMGFVTTDVELYLGGEAFAPVRAVNKTADMQAPVIFTRDYITDTASLDKRFPGLVKALVDGPSGRISGVARGETVSLPEAPGSFVVCMTQKQWEQYGGRFGAGTACRYAVRANVDIEKAKAAISGGGFMLVNGQAADIGDTVSPASRQPRTLLGISRDQRRVVMMVIDGRGDSAGATSAEAAALMLEYGAWTAMHLDGGGSSTMVAYDSGLDGPAVRNEPSDGAQRKVVNALGLFVDAPAGGVAGIVMTGDEVQAAGKLELGVYGVDAYNRRFGGALSGVTYECATAGAAGGAVTAKAGTHTVTARFGYATATKTVRVIEPAELIPGAASIKGLVGVAAELTFTGRDGDGYAAHVPPERLTYEVFPPDLGLADKAGRFLPLRVGRGYVKCTYAKAGGGAVSAYVPVDATLDLVPANGLSTAAFSSYPASVKGAARAATALGTAASELTYGFAASPATQAAYLNLNAKAYAAGFRVTVIGDGSGHWARAKATDAAGKAYTLDVTRNIDFDGAADFDVWYPASAAQPVTLNQLYVVSTNEQYGLEHTVTFANLQIFVYIGDNLPSVAVPASDKAEDPMGTGPADGPLFTGELKAGGSGGVAEVPMRGKNGGFAKTDAKQYAALSEAAKGAARAVVVTADIDPMSLSKSEFAVFHEILAGMVKGGKAVFVVSATSAAWEAGAAARDGVRYVKLGGGYAALRVNIGQGGAVYGLEAAGGR